MVHSTGPASLGIWLGRLVGQQVWAYLASWLIGISTIGQLGNLGSNGPCWVAEWWFGPFSRPVGWFLVQWAMLAGWLVGWVGNLSWV
jgi:hypothetical protein